MKHASPLRVCSAQCFYFLLACLYYPPGTQPLLFALFVAACLIFGFLAIRTENIGLRILCVLPPAALALLSKGWIPAALTAPAWLYFVHVYVANRTQISYESYRTAFYLRLLFAAIAFPVMKLIPPLDHNLMPDLCFLVAWFFSGILALREIRMGVTTNLRWRLYSTLSLAVPVAVTAGVSALIPLVGKPVAKVFGVLFSPLVAVYWAIYKAAEWFFKKVGSPEMDDIQIASGIPETQYVAPAETYAREEPEYFGPNDEPNWLLVIGIIAAAAVALVMLLLMIRYLRASRKEVREKTLESMDEAPFFQKLRRRKKEHVVSEGDRVREIYRTYLRELQSHGQKIFDTNTSLEILNDAEKANVTEADEKLRQIYLVARYGDAKQITISEANAAQKYLNEIQNAFEAARRRNNASDPVRPKQSSADS